MKIKEGFLLRQIAGQNVVLPTGNELDLNMMITLNDTGVFLWEWLQKKEQSCAEVQLIRAAWRNQAVLVEQPVLINNLLADGASSKWVSV